MEVDEAGPPRIQRLSESTINRIAAGEVIQKPANAVKELLENALDAGSTRIVVTVKEGGTKLLSIQDNGSGIAKDDLPILCERFTTSKIKAYEDLSRLTTYGFRGEALASISHVARLSVTTKTKAETCGYKAAYSDGKLVPLKTGQDAEPKPIAAAEGTLISIEELFYNVPLRRQALRPASEEYARIFDVVSRYAIHNAGTAIACRKGGGNSTPDLSTSQDATVLDNIGIVFGEPLKRELVRFELGDEDLGLEAEGYVSNANYSAKKGTFLLFINHRLVGCPALQRAFENHYATLLPRGGHAFVYLSLLIAPEKVDVNMHPTKAQVSFLDEDDIVDAAAERLAQVLANANQSRVFKVQTVLPGVLPTAAPVASTSKLPPQKLVRTDTQAQTLEAMLGYDATQGGPSKFRSGQAIDLTMESDGSADEAPTSTGRSKIQVADCQLTSVNSLRRQVLAAKQATVHEVLRNHTFVGFVGLDTPQLILQHGTKMYLVPYFPVCDALFYQLGLRQFGKLPRTKLKPPPSLRHLVQIAVSRQQDLPTHLTPDVVIDKVCERLESRREMLSEYFSLVISEDGLVTAIPLLLPRFAPNLEKLPLFLLKAGVQVNWTAEKECFSSFLRELAIFHRPGPLVLDASVGATTTPQDQHLVQHVIFPAVKQYLEAPASLLHSITALTSMEELFRRFGRC